MAILIVFQSCVTVYKSKNLTLEEVNDRYIKTKIITKSGEKLKFKNIAFENGIGSSCLDLWFILASNNSDCCGSLARSNKLVSLSPI